MMPPVRTCLGRGATLLLRLRPFPYLATRKLHQLVIPDILKDDELQAARRIGLRFLVGSSVILRSVLSTVYGS